LPTFFHRVGGGGQPSRTPAECNWAFLAVDPVSRQATDVIIKKTIIIEISIHKIL
jgi:hypothetical protein